MRTRSDTSWTSVFVVEDDDECRHAMVRSLEQWNRSVQGFRCASDFLDSLTEESRGCLVVDLVLPDMSGHHLVAELAGRGFFLPVVFISGSASVADAASAMRKGAVDFLEKPFNGKELADRVDEALQRGRRQEGQAHFIADVEQRIATLAPRERQVMHMVCDGMPTKVIARQLDISPKTVEVYRSRITKTMRTESVPQLVRIVNDYKHAANQMPAAQHAPNGQSVGSDN